MRVSRAVAVLYRREPGTKNVIFAFISNLPKHRDFDNGPGKSPRGPGALKGLPDFTITAGSHLSCT